MGLTRVTTKVLELTRISLLLQSIICNLQILNTSTELRLGGRYVQRPH